MDLTGTLVFASGRQVDFDLWTLDLQSMTLKQLTSGSFLYDTPSWSPDGSQIVCVRTGEDLIPSICVLNRDGGEEQQLTKNIYCQHPSWSPCGNYILFTSNAADPNEIEVSRLERESGEIEPLLRRKGLERDPSYSPDGTKIVFAAFDQKSERQLGEHNTEIWEYDLNEKRERKVSSHPARDYCPVYSPDGTQIAFVSHRNNRSAEEYLSHLESIIQSVDPNDMETVDKAIREIPTLEMDSDIFVIHPDGTELRQLTDNGGCDVGLCWSPDGKYLAYSASVRGDTHQERLCVVEVATGKEEKLDYDRSALKAELGATERKILNNTLWQRALPDFIERRLVSQSFWGEERQPHWTDK